MDCVLIVKSIVATPIDKMHEACHSETTARTCHGASSFVVEPLFSYRGSAVLSAFGVKGA